MNTSTFFAGFASGCATTVLLAALATYIFAAAKALKLPVEWHGTLVIGTHVDSVHPPVESHMPGIEVGLRKDGVIVWRVKK